MTEKIEIMEALQILAQEHKDHSARLKRIEETSTIRPCYYDGGEVHIYKGLIGSGLELEKRTYEKFRDEYGIMVDGVRFFEMSKEPVEVSDDI